MRVCPLLVKVVQEVWNNYCNQLLLIIIILGAASTTNESVPSTGKGRTRGMEYYN